jgi:hypothetical protein
VPWLERNCQIQALQFPSLALDRSEKLIKGPPALIKHEFRHQAHRVARLAEVSQSGIVTIFTTMQLNI